LNRRESNADTDFALICNKRSNLDWETNKALISLLAREYLWLYSGLIDSMIKYGNNRIFDEPCDLPIASVNQIPLGIRSRIWTIANY
jgi:hypothetical protein